MVQLVTISVSSCDDVWRSSTWHTQAAAAAKQLLSSLNHRCRKTQSL